MTNEEYITLNLSKFGLEGSDITYLLKKFKKEPNDSANEQELDLLMYENVRLIMPIVKNVSEGGTSIGWNAEKVAEGFKRWYSMLSDSLGKEDVFASKISDETNKW